MLDVDDLTDSIKNYVEKYSENHLYENGFSDVESNVFHNLIDKSKELKGDELANVFHESLEEDERTEVVIEELIEKLEETHEDFETLLDDLEIQSYTPIDLLEKYNKVE